MKISSSITFTLRHHQTVSLFAGLDNSRLILSEIERLHNAVCYLLEQEIRQIGGNFDQEGYVLRWLVSDSDGPKGLHLSVALMKPAKVSVSPTELGDGLVLATAANRGFWSSETTQISWEKSVGDAAVGVESVSLFLADKLRPE